jgi:hypothetical protein
VRINDTGHSGDDNSPAGGVSYQISSPFILQMFEMCL